MAKNGGTPNIIRHVVMTANPTGRAITAVKAIKNAVSRYPFPNGKSGIFPWGDESEITKRKTVSLMKLDSENIQLRIKNVLDVSTKHNGVLQIVGLSFYVDFLCDVQTGVDANGNPKIEKQIDSTMPQGLFTVATYPELLTDRTPEECNKWSDMVKDNGEPMSYSAYTLYDLWQQYGLEFKPSDNRDEFFNQTVELANAINAKRSGTVATEDSDSDIVE